ncbi:MAG: TlpA family protein disulfide reductase [Deltaproteobacteria bacterium]|nr:TlpA family protein disulfide reductase [Deltaproteobacteria bacterium]
MRTRPAVAVATALLVVLAGWSASLAGSLGERAPAFALPGLVNGRLVSLQEFRGRPVVLNFFAAWCQPCWAEMPVLQRAYERYRASGVVVIGIGVFDDARSLRAMVEKLGITFPVVYDRDGVAARAYRLWGLPLTLGIDARGTIRRVLPGALDEQRLEKAIQVLR